jgi:hypothetical protein
MVDAELAFGPGRRDPHLEYDRSIEAKQRSKKEDRNRVTRPVVEGSRPAWVVVRSETDHAESASIESDDESSEVEARQFC